MFMGTRIIVNVISLFELFNLFLTRFALFVVQASARKQNNLKTATIGRTQFRKVKTQPYDGTQNIEHSGINYVAMFQIPIE